MNQLLLELQSPSAISLKHLSQPQLERWAMQAQARIQGGHLPDYIPRLSQANPHWFAAQIRCVDGQAYTVGQQNLSFPLMSVVKPLTLLFLLQTLGQDAVWHRVGQEASDYPFNSLEQLERDQGWPRNPMINSGAIVLASLLPGANGAQRCYHLCQWLNQHAGCQLFLDQAMLDSVRAGGGKRNQAIGEKLVEFGTLTDLALALDTYNHICCLSGTVEDAARLGMLLAQPQSAIAPNHQQAVNAVLITCGLYQASQQFAAEVGLPTKSGVSGLVLSMIPGQGVVGCYSPALDATGNSIAGMAFLKLIAQSLPVK